MRHRATLAVAALALAVAWSHAGEEPGAEFAPKGPLAGLPSEAGPHVAKIRALGGDAWLDLGSPAPDPKWGKARGRAWTPKMPFAPELRAAFLCGCGIHGFVKPDGHFMDDFWAYDIQAHRWVCVYPGAHTKTLDLKLDKDGFEVNKDGEHIPVAFMSHGYHNQTYVPHLHKAMFAFTHCPWWSRAMPQRWEWLDQNDPDVQRRNYGHAGPLIESPKHPLFYDVAEGRWERKLVAGDGPHARRFEGVLEYLPTRKQVFYLYQGKVWFYDFAANAWTASKAERVPVGYDSWGCYDARRDRVYVARKELFLAYDVKADQWSPIRGEAQPADLGSCAHGAITYDTNADAVVILRTGGAGLDIYDPERNSWSKAAAPAGADWRRRTVAGFYDPELNAHFYHLAGDSADNGFILVYRYRTVKGQAR